MVRQDGSVDDWAKTAGPSPSPDATTSAGHGERTSGLLSQVQLHGKQLVRGHIEELAPLTSLKAKLLQDHHRGFGRHFAGEHANAGAALNRGLIEEGCSSGHRVEA